MSRRRRFKLVQDLAALIGGQLSSKVVGLAAFAYLARTLDPDAYGTVEYVVGLAMVFGMVIDWGLGPIGVRMLATAPERLPSLAALIPTARLGIALAAIPLMGVTVVVLGRDAETVQLGLLFALGMLGLPWKQDWLLQGLEMMTAVAAAQLIRMAVFAIAAILLVHSSRDLVRVGIAEIVAAAVFAAYYLVIQRLWVAPIRLELAFREIWRLLREGYSVGLASMIWAFLQYAPLILLGSVVGGAETGWFAAAHRIVVSLLALSWVYQFNLYPAIARRSMESPEALRRLVGASFRVVAWGGIWSALVLTLLARPLLVLAFGADFAAAAPAFAVLIWTLPVTLLSAHARAALIATGRQRCVLVAHIAGLAVLLGVGVASIPTLQALGAAIAMLAGPLTVWAVAHVYAVRQIGQVARLSVVVPPAALAILAVLGARLLTTDPLLATALAATGYALSAPLVDRRLLADLRHLAAAKA